MFEDSRRSCAARAAWQLSATFSLLLVLAACGGGGSSTVKAPPAPTGVTATAGEGQVALSWSAAPEATSYRVLRSATSGGPYAPIASPEGTSHTDRGLTNGTTYHYVIHAVNSGGESPASTEVSATPMAAATPPAAPANLMATPGDTVVALSWSASAGAASYELQRDANCTGTFITVATPTGMSHTDTGLTNGTPYCYVVRARNAVGSSPASTQARVTPRAASSAPPAPANLRATPGNAQVALDWDASTGAASYEVQRDPGCTGTFTTVATPTSVTHTDTGLTNGTAYCYVVRARNSAGTSPASSQVSATPQAAPLPPPAPTGLGATPGDAQVALSWSASAGATSYEVQRDVNCTGSFSTVATPTGTSHTDTGLTNGTPYCYVVRAKNAAGTSAASSQVRATPESTSTGVPPAPAGVSATPGDGQVALSWSASTGATGYTVQRGTAPGGSYADVGTPSTTSFTDTSLGNGRRYYYVVRATNTAGSSSPSTEVSAVPLSGRELCVTNENAHTVAVFDPTATGDVPPLRRLGNLTGMDNLQAVAFDRVNNELYVANTAGSPYSPAYPVTVYARTAAGNVAPIRVIGGADTGLGGAAGIAVDPTNNEVFVSWNGAIRVFPRTANGNVAPLRTLNLCAGCAPGIAVAPAHNELFVPSGNSIVTYARTATGSAAPLRTLSGSFTELSNPTSVAYDAVHDEIITTSTNSAIGIFPRTAAGNFAPTRTIYADVPAGLTGITYAAVNDTTGEVFVASTTSVAVFPRTADQGVDPSRKISGANVGFGRPLGVAVDPANGELFIGDGAARRLVVHGLSANGNVAPMRTLSGISGGVEYPTGIGVAPVAGKLFVSNSRGASVTAYTTPWAGTPTPSTTLRGASTALGTPSAIAIDEGRGEVFVTNAPGADSVTVYALGADGNTAPVRSLSGNLTGLSGPYGVAVDATNNELFVANNAKTITVYGRTASGNVAPVRTLGPSSFLGSPVGIAVDATNGELVVVSATATASEILVFTRNASGTAAPIRKISGAATQLSGASDVVVDTARNELLVTNATGASITVFARTANGDVAPLRRITGASTLLSQPSGATLCK
jgi:fibronectin type 3 domain-containing protein/6-phosphogluconolactonase (cycloisomerase 2 family)